MSGSTSGPPTPAPLPDGVSSHVPTNVPTNVPATAPITADVAATGSQTMSMDDFDTLNRVVSQALGICDAVQVSSDLSEQHASALWAAVDLLSLGRGILQKYALAPLRHG